MKRSSRIAAVTTIVVAFVMLAAGPAAAIPEPVLECVAANPDGSYTAVLSVNNTGSDITIPVGNNTNGQLDNRFNGQWDRGQPTFFPAGLTVGIFTLTVLDGEPEQWRLGESRLRIDRGGAPCSDVPVAPDVPFVVLGALAAAAGGAWALRRVDGVDPAT